jgi:hypothetical protein
VQQQEPRPAHPPVRQLPEHREQQVQLCREQQQVRVCREQVRVCREQVQACREQQVQACRELQAQTCRGLQGHHQDLNPEILLLPAHQEHHHTFQVQVRILLHTFLHQEFQVVQLLHPVQMLPAPLPCLANQPLPLAAPTARRCQPQTINFCDTTKKGDHGLPFFYAFFVAIMQRSEIREQHARCGISLDQQLNFQIT